MSKIFEALQFAQTERLQQGGKLSRQVPTAAKVDTQVLEPAPVPEVRTERVPVATPPKADTQVLEPGPVSGARTESATERLDDTQVLRPSPVPEVRTERADRTACNCEQWSHRIRRQGIWDFLLGLLGLYPWKCSHCHRHFHRLRRY